jgi:glycerol-3-phosphate dehydrogenase
MDASLSTLTRAATLDGLERETFDCVVIGGGITGAGIVREATLRGLSAALLEAADFAAGTSSRSSKLIHGGLRYLAMGDIGLVRETALERKRIFRLAPHLAEPRRMLVPTRSRTGLLKLRAAIAAYERLGAVEEEDRHQNWSAEELEREEPALDSEQHPWVCAYREYLTDDARLVLANLRDAARRGARVLNHAPVERILQQDGRACGVEARCAQTGRVVRIGARAVVNAAGPWVEAVQRLEDSEAPPLLHLSEGIHVVISAQRLPVRNMIVLQARDRRSIFAIRRGGVVFVGTTDTTYTKGSELWPEINREDVEYLLEPIPRYFRVDAIAPEECVGAWAGLRPLIAESGKDSEEISRRHEVLVGPAGVITVAGGKLTGYRPMARRVVERVPEVIGTPLAPPASDEEPLPGADFDGDLDRLAAALARDAALPLVVAERLVRLYGTESSEVARLGAAPLVEGAAILAGEVDWAVREEGALRLEDVVYRRTRMALYDPETREAGVPAVAARMAALLGWSEERTAEEVAAVRTRLAADLAFRGSSA